MFVTFLQALDKIRFLALTDKDVLGEGDNAKLEIQVSYIFFGRWCVICSLSLRDLKFF